MENGICELRELHKLICLSHVKRPFRIGAMFALNMGHLIAAFSNKGLWKKPRRASGRGWEMALWRNSLRTHFKRTAFCFCRKVQIIFRGI
jgi:hypothetical protein